jgi:hypothetical protein
MAAARICSGLVTEETTASDQARNLSRSEAGMPSSSLITVTGSGNANDSSKSTVSSSRAARSSSSEAVISAMRGRRSATRRAVNALVTSRRTRS